MYTRYNIFNLFPTDSKIKKAKKPLENFLILVIFFIYKNTFQSENIYSAS